MIIKEIIKFFTKRRLRKTFAILNIFWAIIGVLLTTRDLIENGSELLNLIGKIIYFTGLVAFGGFLVVLSSLFSGAIFLLIGMFFRENDKLTDILCIIGVLFGIWAFAGEIIKDPTLYFFFEDMWFGLGPYLHQGTIYAAGLFTLVWGFLEGRRFLKSIKKE